MSKLHNISPNAVNTIREGMQSLSEAFLEINAIVGDSSSKITVEGNNLVVKDSNTFFKNKVGIGVDTIADNVDLETKNAVRFQSKKFEVGNQVPVTGVYRKGDIVWTDDPVPNGILGWICIRSGSPGEWRQFGQIGGV
jgi:hypothetical protein